MSWTKRKIVNFTVFNPVYHDDTIVWKRFTTWKARTVDAGRVKCGIKSRGEQVAAILGDALAATTAPRQQSPVVATSDSINSFRRQPISAHKESTRYVSFCEGQYQGDQSRASGFTSRQIQFKPHINIYIYMFSPSCCGTLRLTCSTPYFNEQLQLFASNAKNKNFCAPWKELRKIFQWFKSYLTGLGNLNHWRNRVISPQKLQIDCNFFRQQK